ncbi:CCB3/YggT-like [Parasponia andersonii]|uniref:CCB3/YggT-like n=1 Tax=Parasponia andersonii TaxID=3476 RepID=A0A2P5BWI7_PARAD|nr:CCB3/YggT-like [Parasponia andersonii]
MASSTSLMASSQALYLPNPNLYPHKPIFSYRSANKPFRSSPNPRISLSLSLLRNPKLQVLQPMAASTSPPQTPSGSSLTGSTRTLTTLFALALTVVRKFSVSIFKLGSSLPQQLSLTAGPLFFAALRDRPSGYLNTPLTVVAAGLSKWLDIYSGVLMVRVLLSWFPNIPWEKQPLSAIRDLCDPYLNLFRNIIPPVFDTLDVSPLLAFAVLGTLGSILNSSRGMY